MYFLMGFVFALCCTLILTIAFSPFHRASREQMGVFWFFLLVFLITWAGGVWVVPFGPLLFGVAWLPFLLVALMTLLLISAISHSRTAEGPRRNQGVSAAARERDKDMASTLNAFFWLLVGALAFVIILRAIQ